MALLADQAVADQPTLRLAEVEQLIKVELVEAQQQDLAVVVVVVQIPLAQAVDLI
jgi:hypothetical protein